MVVNVAAENPGKGHSDHEGGQQIILFLVSTLSWSFVLDKSTKNTVDCESVKFQVKFMASEWPS